MKFPGLFPRRAKLESIACEAERLPSGGVRLISTTLRGEGLRELELAEVPSDLVAEGTDLLSRLTRAALRERPARDGDTLAGQFVDDAQPVVHIATLRIVSRTITPGAAELFRVVDFGEAASERIAFRILATHLALLATREKGLRHRLRLAQRSVELHAGAAATSDGRFEFDRGENLGNFIGWETLADALVDSGREEEGIAALRNAVTRCPAWATDFAAHIRASSGAASSRDPRIQFWLRQ